MQRFGSRFSRWCKTLNNCHLPWVMSFLDSENHSWCNHCMKRLFILKKLFYQHFLHSARKTSKSQPQVLKQHLLLTRGRWVVTSVCITLQEVRTRNDWKHLNQFILKHHYSQKLVVLDSTALTAVFLLLKVPFQGSNFTDKFKKADKLGFFKKNCKFFVRNVLSIRCNLVFEPKTDWDKHCSVQEGRWFVQQT